MKAIWICLLICIVLSGCYTSVDQQENEHFNTLSRRYINFDLPEKYTENVKKISTKYTSKTE